MVTVSAEVGIMRKAPKGFRLHIGIFGRRNVGKSSILNGLTGQDVSIVAPEAGTTTDPVEKPMELLTIGPVLFIDTAGVDDIGALGGRRIEKTRQVLRRTDLALLVTEADQWGDFENDLIEELDKLGIPAIVAFNKSDLSRPSLELREATDLRAASVCVVSTLTQADLEPLRLAITAAVPPESFASPVILRDLVPAGRIAVLVVPIDKEAPKGRLILPQVQSIRDLLEGGAAAVVCRDSELRSTLDQLGAEPAMVVTDSQAFLRVAKETPEKILMTSFSILFARLKGDLVEMTQAVKTIERLKTGDRILIAEACTHHPIEDDIGTVKIPAWLRAHIEGDLEIDHCRGYEFPEDLSAYKLIIHCGACMWNRREMLSRLRIARHAGVPLTNYGLTIAYTLGILERALRPFPEAHRIYLETAGC